MANETKVGGIEFDVKVNSKQANQNIDETDKNINELGDSTKKVDEQINKSSENVKLKTTAMAVAIGVAVAKVVKDVASAVDSFENGRAELVRGTGATGDELESLLSSSKDVFKNSEQSFEDVSKAIAEVNTRFGVVGTTLNETTDRFLKFSKIAGGDVKNSISSISQLSQRWNLSFAEMPALMDKLVVASQKSGIGIDTLNTALIDTSGTFQAMGLSLDESIALISQFEKVGISSSSVVMAMKKSFEDSANAGTNAKDDWEKLIESIKNATDETQANEIAVKTFGARVGTDMVSAIRSGKLNFEEFTTAIEKSSGALEQTDKDSETTADKFKKLKNSFSEMIMEIGESVSDDVLTSLNNLREPLGDIAKNLLPLMITGLEKLVNFIRPTINFLGDTADLLNIIGDKVGGFFEKIIGSKGEIKNEFDVVNAVIEEIAKTTDNATESITNLGNAISTTGKGAGQDLPEITTEVYRLTEDVKKAFKEMWGEITDNSKEAQKNWANEFVGVFKNAFGEIEKLLSEQVVGAFEEVGNAIAGGEQDWELYRINALKSIKQVLEGMAKELALLAIKALLMGNFVGAGIAAAGAIAAGVGAGALGSVISDMQKQYNMKQNEKAEQEAQTQKAIDQQKEILDLEEKIAKLKRGEDYLTEEERKIQQLQDEFNNLKKDYDNSLKENETLKGQLNAKNQEAESRRIEAEQKLYDLLYGKQQQQISDLLSGYHKLAYGIYDNFNIPTIDNRLSAVVNMDGEKVGEIVLKNIDESYRYVGVGV